MNRQETGSSDMSDDGRIRGEFRTALNFESEDDLACKMKLLTEGSSPLLWFLKR